LYLVVPSKVPVELISSLLRAVNLPFVMEDYVLTMDGCLRLNEQLQKKIANDMPGEIADVLTTLMASDIKGKLKVRAPCTRCCPDQPARLERRLSDACLHTNPQNIAESKLGATVQKLTKHDDGKVNSLATKLKNSWAAAAAQAKAAKAPASEVKPDPGAKVEPAVEPAPAAAAAAATAAAAAAAAAAAETKPMVSGPSSSGLVATVKPEPVPLTASSSISVSAPSRSTSKTGDQTRDMVREKLQDAFEVGKEANARYLREQYVDTAAMAEEAENNMNAHFGGTTKDYKARFRSLIFNLKDKNNPEFIRMVMTGQLHVNDLAVMEVREMASDEMKKQRAAHTEYAKMALMDSKTYKQYAGKETQDGILKCPRCKSMKTEYVEVQTRSADEPTTKKCTCNNCEYRWKFC